MKSYKILVIVLCLLLVLISIATAKTTLTKLCPSTPFCIFPATNVTKTSVLYAGDSVTWSVPINATGKGSYMVFFVSNHTGNASALNSAEFNVTIWNKAHLLPLAIGRLPGDSLWLEAASQNTTVLYGGDSLLVNYRINTSISVPTPANFTLFYLANNTGNGSELNSGSIMVNIVSNANIAPSITLSKPDNESIIGTSIIDFNWTVIDSSNASMTCLFNLNNALNKTKQCSSGTLCNQQITGIPEGNYTWNVNCSDGLLIGTSLTRSFTIRFAPSLSIINPTNQNYKGDVYISYEPLYSSEVNYYNLSIDSVLFKSNYASPNYTLGTYTNYSDGQHNLSIMLCDVYGICVQNSTLFTLNNYIAFNNSNYNEMIELANSSIRYLNISRTSNITNFQMFIQGSSNITNTIFNTSEQYMVNYTSNIIYFNQSYGFDNNLNTYSTRNGSAHYFVAFNFTKPPLIQNGSISIKFNNFIDPAWVGPQGYTNIYCQNKTGTSPQETLDLGKDKETLYSASNNGIYTLDTYLPNSCLNEQNGTLRLILLQYSPTSAEVPFLYDARATWYNMFDYNENKQPKLMVSNNTVWNFTGQLNRTDYNFTVNFNGTLNNIIQQGCICSGCIINRQYCVIPFEFSVNSSFGVLNYSYMTMTGTDDLGTFIHIPEDSASYTNQSVLFDVVSLGSKLSSCWYDNGTSVNTTYTCNSSFMLTLPQATYNYTFYANDSNGTEVSDSVSFSTYNAPNITIHIPLNTTYTWNTSFGFNITFTNESTSTMIFSIDNGTNSSQQGSVSFSLDLARGAHQIKVWLVDALNFTDYVVLDWHINNEPTQGTPVLSKVGGLVSNLSCANVSTSDMENQSVKNIVTWLRNGSTEGSMELNMPFESVSTASDWNNYFVKDYVHNITGIRNNATLFRNGSYDGSGFIQLRYKINVTSEGNSYFYINNTNLTTSLMWDNVSKKDAKFTVSFRLRFDERDETFGGEHTLFMSYTAHNSTNSLTNYPYWYVSPRAFNIKPSSFIQNNSYIQFFMQRGGGDGIKTTAYNYQKRYIIYNQTIINNLNKNWSLVTFVFNGTESNYDINDSQLFINGQEMLPEYNIVVTALTRTANVNYTNQSTIPPQQYITNKLMIGSIRDNIRNQANVSIDDLTIWRTALSAQQIRELYLNNTQTIVSQDVRQGGSYQCTITPNDGWQDGFKSYSNILQSDNIPPVWSNNVTNAINYETYNPTKAYNFSINFTDNVAMLNITFNFNGTNSTVNCSGLTCNMTVSYSTLSAGTYFYYWIGSDNSSNYNQTQVWNFTIQKANSSVVLFINNSQTNLTMAYNTYLNITAYSNFTPTIYINGEVVANPMNISDRLAYNATAYNITAIQTDSANYTSNSTTLWIRVNKQDSKIMIYIGGTLNSSSMLKNSNVTFNVSISGVQNSYNGTDNVNFYHNFTGTWHLNYTAANPLNLTFYTNYSTKYYEVGGSWAGNWNYSAAQTNLTVYIVSLNITVTYSCGIPNFTYSHSPFSVWNWTVNLTNSSWTTLGFATDFDDVTLSSVKITNSTSGQRVQANNFTIVSNRIKATNDSAYKYTAVNISARVYYHSIVNNSQKRIEPRWQNDSCGIYNVTLENLGSDSDASIWVSVNQTIYNITFFVSNTSSFVNTTDNYSAYWNVTTIQTANTGYQVWANLTRGSSKMFWHLMDLLNTTPGTKILYDFKFEARGI